LKDCSAISAGVVSGVQVGITLASLSLGYLGENHTGGNPKSAGRSDSAAVAAVIADGVALVIAFGLLTFCR